MLAAVYGNTSRHCLKYANSTVNAMNRSWAMKAMKAALARARATRIKCGCLWVFNYAVYAFLAEALFKRAHVPISLVC